MALWERGGEWVMFRNLSQTAYVCKVQSKVFYVNLSSAPVLYPFYFQLVCKRHFLSHRVKCCLYLLHICFVNLCISSSVTCEVSRLRRKTR